MGEELPDIADELVDRLLRGEAADVERFVAEHAELAPEAVAKLRKLARVLGGEKASALPEKVGPYRLVRRLGSGGQGMVFLAEDERLARRVAVKLIRPEMALAERARRHFEQEARAVAQLAHEHIVTIFDVGAEGATLYLAMELIDGRGLDELLAEARGAQKRMRIDDVLRWGVQIARALDAAHRAGIVHRDVKPSNIRIAESGKAKLLDFGLALSGEGGASTRVGRVRGTLHYVSPEQISGPAALLDGRADQWSLGVTLYECLTGRRPFEGDDVEEVFASIARREPPPPRELAPRMSAELATVVLKTLEKRRERRYGSCEELARDLEAVRDGRPISARPAGAWSRGVKWCRRNPALATSIALGALVAVGGPIAFGVLEARHRAALAAEKLEVDRRNVELEARAAELVSLSEFQGSMLRRLPVDAMGERILAILREQVEVAARRSGASEPEVAQRAADLERALAGVHVSDVSRSAIDRSLVAPTLEALETQFAGQPLVQASLYGKTSEVLYELGMHERALESARRAVELFEANEGESDEDFVSALANYGLFLGNCGQFEESERANARAAEVSRRELGDVATTWSCLHNHALALRRVGRASEAEPIYREVLAKRTAGLGEDDPLTLQTANNLAAVWMQLDRPSEARELFERVHEARRRVLGEESVETLRAASNLAVALEATNEVERAAELLDATWRRARAALGDGHDETLHVLAQVAAVERRRGEYAKAYERQVEIHRALLAARGPEHPDTLTAMNELAVTAWDLGRLDEARCRFDLAWSGRERVLGPDHPDTLRTAIGRAALLQQLGALEEAWGLGLAAACACTERFGASHGLTARARAHVARALAALGRSPEALAELGAAWSDVASDSNASLEAQSQVADGFIDVLAARAPVEAAVASELDEWRERAALLRGTSP